MGLDRWIGVSWVRWWRGFGSVVAGGFGSWKLVGFSMEIGRFGSVKLVGFLVEIGGFLG